MENRKLAQKCYKIYKFTISSNALNYQKHKNCLSATRMKNKEKRRGGGERYPGRRHFNNPVECLFFIFANTHDFSNIYVKKSSGKCSNLNVKTRSRNNSLKIFWF